MPFAAFFIFLLLLVSPQGHAALSTGQAASLVIGQSSLGTGTPATTQTGLNSPVVTAFDPSGNLWVVEQGNSRVLEFTTPFSNGEAASLVIGQSSFTSNTVNSGFASCNGSPVTSGTISACGLSIPKNLAFDKAGDLWVSDFGNNRVLEFVPGSGGCSVGFCTGMAASFVIGQTGFSTGGGSTTQSSFNIPFGLAFDTSGDLWVADQNNMRVLEFQFSASGTATTGTSGTTLDDSTQAWTPSQWVGFTVTITSGTGIGSTGVVTSNAASSLVVGSWSGAAPASGSGYSIGSPPDGMNAALVLGHALFTQGGAGLSSTAMHNPHGITFDPSGNLWVWDTTNNRVLEFVPGTGGCPAGQFCTGMAASVVIGQSGFSGGSANAGFASCNGSPVTAGTVSQCGLNLGIIVGTDQLGDVWVSDSNNRILEFVPGTGGCPAGQFCTGMPASLVMGQSSFSGATANAAFASCNGSPVTSGTISACGLSGARGISFDAYANLWITDSGNNRILEYANLIEAITPSPVTIDSGQTITLTSHNTGGIGPYTYQWYTAPGPGTCTTSDTSLRATTTTYAVPSSTPPGTYNYCYIITDGTGASAGSPTDAVTVDATTVGAITPASPTIDIGQMITLTSAAASGGTGSGFTYLWYSGTSANCSSDTTTLGTALTQSVSPTSNTDYCVQVTDTGVTSGASTLFSSTDLVAVNPALSAGVITPPSPIIDSGQSVTLTANPSGGTMPSGYQWYSGSSAACSSDTTALGMASTQSVNPTSNTYYCYMVTDASTDAPTVFSTTDLVTVNTALGTPTVAPSATTIDSGQTISGTVSWTGGTANYNVNLYSSSTGTCSSGSTLASSQTGLTASSAIFTGLSPLSTLYYCATVTDSAGTPVTTTSPAVQVPVNSALVAPVISVAPTTIDSGQASALSTTTSFSGGTSSYTCQWLQEAPGGGYSDLGSSFTSGCTTSSLPSTSTGTLSTTGTWNFKLQVTDSGSPAVTVYSSAVSVTVNSALTPPSTPTISAAALDVDQVETVTGTIPSTGTSAYSWQWMISVNGGAYAPSTQCAVDNGAGASAGAPETCTISGGTLTAGSNYAFKLQVTDSATTPETTLSSASATVTVSAKLTAPSAPSISAAALDVDQVETVTGTIPSTGTSTYSWQWMISINGGAFASSTQCVANSGTGASGGATETCTINGSTLTAGHTYTFELQVTDSATTPETTTSSASPTVTASLALTAPSAPTISAAALDINQVETVTRTIPATGTPTYSWNWMTSINGGAYSPSTQCAINSGAGANAGAAETCTISGGTLTSGDTYAFKLQVTDSASTPETTTSTASATVTVNPVLSTPTVTPSASTIDAGQSIGVQVSWTGGTSAYTIHRYDSPTSTCTTSSGIAGTQTGQASSPYTFTGLMPSANTWYCATVTDSATTPVTSAVSSSVEVIVNPILVAGAITPSTPVIESGQSVTLTAQPSGGTIPYSYRWYTGPSCTSPISGAKLSTYSASVAGIYYYKVTDSVSETACSAGDMVAVNLALSAPVISASPATIDSGQASRLSTTSALSGGTSPYTCQWLQEAPGASSYTNLGGSFVSGCNALPTTTTGALPAAGTWHFELQVTDSASTPVTVTSSALTVRVITPSTTSVSCSPTSLAVGSSATCTATVSGYDPTDTVTWTASKGLSITTTTCTLPTQQQGCAVTVTGVVPGSMNVTALYSGDQNNTGSQGQAMLTVVGVTTTSTTSSSTTSSSTSSSSTSSSSSLTTSSTSTTTSVAPASPSPSMTVLIAVAIVLVAVLLGAVFLWRRRR